MATLTKRVRKLTQHCHYKCWIPILIFLEWICRWFTLTNYKYSRTYYSNKKNLRLKVMLITSRAMFVSLCPACFRSLSQLFCCHFGIFFVDTISMKAYGQSKRRYFWPFALWPLHLTSLDSGAEVVVSDASVPWWGGMQSSSWSEGLELCYREQDQNY